MTRKGCVILIGMPGVGKSTVGVLLAKQLARPFVDVDVYIQAGTDRSLQEIIDTDGLAAFCHLESMYVCCLDLANHVVATGGSVVYSPEAMEFLRQAGTTVYLELPLVELQQRLSDLRARGVVMPAGMSLADLYAQREGLYRKWADRTVHCSGLNHQEVVDAVVAALQGS